MKRQKTLFEGSAIQQKENRSPRQTILSVVILIILMIITVGLLITQSRYNPAVLQKGVFLAETHGSKPTPQLSSSPLFLPLPEGIQPFTPAETFDTQTLSDKIDGKAELYLSAGFNRLTSQRFKDERAPELWMEVFVYDMGSSQNAFSVFSTQRRKGAAFLDLAQNAYRTANALFLTHGPYYVEIIASKTSDDVLKPLKTMAETFVKNTPVKTAKMSEKEIFPEAGRMKDSVALIASDAFGYEAFDNIYTAEYESEGQSLMAYLSHRKTTEEAKQMASDYAAFLLAFGGKVIQSNLPMEGAQIIEVLDTYEIVFSKGPYLAGVREAASAGQAETLAKSLYERIKE
jgi:hypothetical protein